MLTSRSIKVLHLESTDVCQATCAQCSRETDPEFEQGSGHHLAMHQVRQHLSLEQIQELDKMFMCGNYGDPAAGRNTLDLYQQFRDINPDIVLGMNTNGALQNQRWWRRLAQQLDQPQDYVVFSIDGLADTNHIYRRHVDWHRLMLNVSAFVEAGGRAHWDMLIFRHNEHQVDRCETLAKELGFVWFRAKVSKRDLVPGLEYPISWQSASTPSADIDCHALREQSMYIDAQGRASPCCWLGNRQSAFVDDFRQVQLSWGTDHANPVCVRVCSVSGSVTRFDQQWRRDISLC